MSRFTSLMLVLCMGISLFSNGQTKEIPDYILAKNSNFVLVLTTKYFERTSYSTLHNNSAMASHSTSRIDPNSFPSLNEKAFVMISNLIIDRLKTMNLEPADVVSFNSDQMTSSDKTYEMLEKTNNKNPGYLMTLIIMDMSGIEKKVEKGTLSLSDLKSCVLTINKAGENDSKECYVVSGLALNAENIFSKFEKAIKEKPADYFVDEMDVPESKNISKSDVDKLMTEKAEVKNFPDEEKLKESQLLVVIPYPRGNKFTEKDFVKVEELMKKSYPYSYNIISKTEFYDQLTEDNQFAIILKEGTYEVTNTSTNYNNTQSSTSTYNTTMYYGIIKDLSSLEGYYGEDIEKTKKKHYVTPSMAVEALLKQMSKYYQWKK